MITVITEPARKLIRARMGGLLTVKDVESFSRDEQDAARSMGLNQVSLTFLSKRRAAWFRPKK